jgi:hypothetical protein
VTEIDEQCARDADVSVIAKAICAKWHKTWEHVEIKIQHHPLVGFDVNVGGMSTSDPEGAAHGIDGEKEDLRDALMCALNLPVATPLPR